LIINQQVISIIGVLIPDYLFQEAQELVVGDGCDFGEPLVLGNDVFCIPLTTRHSDAHFIAKIERSVVVSIDRDRAYLKIGPLGQLGSDLA
jgi:hypothetical protein